MTEIFRIVLRDAKRYDAFETREFNLPMNSTFPIGRASRNATKTELMPAQNNAFIDSPVVSREHAVFSANDSSGKPEVYITDSGSMHGTHLNDERLAANVPAKLSCGDKLQFGTDVNRNEEYFVARTYAFESQLQHPYSLGFTVPEPDSEEEGLVAHCGSQGHPLVIDDSDAASGQSEVDDDGLTRRRWGKAKPPRQEEPAQPLSPPHDEHPKSTLRTTVVDEDYDEDEDMHVFESHRDDSHAPSSPGHSTEDEDEALGEGSDSEPESGGSSEISYDSELEMQDSEDEEAQETDYNIFVSSNTQETKPSVTLSMPTEESSVTSRPTVQPASYDQLYDGNSMSNGNLFANSPQASMKMPEPSDKPSNESAPSASRSIAPEPMPEFGLWGNSAFDSCGQQGLQQNWYPDEPSFGYIVDRPSLFSPVPPPPAAESVEACAPFSSVLENYADPMPTFQTNRIQTPPLMPVSDIDTSTPLQPGRRTKVTIEEIVEDQPLTPESVNTMKRKADVLEEVEPTGGGENAIASEEAAVVAEEAARNQTTVEAGAVAKVSTQSAAVIAQRPKKVPRSIMSKVLGKATYPLLSVTGAAVSFALLSTLPDSFFT